MADTGHASRPRYTLLPLGAATLDCRFDVSVLHAALLPHSPVALLGTRFMNEFYYLDLVREGLIFGLLARVDDSPAGFMIATADSSGFMSRGLRRYGPRLARVLVLSMLGDPARVRAAWEAWQIMRHLPPAQGELRTGELLSFGVLPEFRAMSFIRRSGIRIARDLHDRIMAELAARGVHRVRSLVDEDNTAAKLFYRASGWSLGEARVPGWKQPVVEFLSDDTGSTTGKRGSELCSS